MKPELPNLPDSDEWCDFPEFVNNLIDVIIHPSSKDVDEKVAMELIGRFLGPGNEHVVQAVKDVVKECRQRMPNERR